MLEKALKASPWRHLELSQFETHNLEAMFVMTNLCNVADWLDTEDPDEVCSTIPSLPGAKYSQIYCVFTKIVLDGVKKLSNNMWPFGLGTPMEWVWWDFYQILPPLRDSLEFSDRESTKFALGLANFYRVATGHGKPVWINTYEGLFDWANELESDMTDLLDCDDGDQVCQSLYPNAWNEELRLASNLNMEVCKSEFDFHTSPLNDWIQRFKPLAMPGKHTESEIKVEPEVKDDIKPNPKVRRKAALYLMKCDNTGLYKIGRSVNPEARERTLQSEAPATRLLNHWSRLGMAERVWHRYFSEQRRRGEWFKLTPAQVRFFALTNSKGIEKVESLIGAATT